MLLLLLLFHYRWSEMKLFVTADGQKKVDGGSPPPPLSSTDSAKTEG